MIKFYRQIRDMLFLNRVALRPLASKRANIKKLIDILAMPDMPCVSGRKRAVSRLFLDGDIPYLSTTIFQAKRMGLVDVEHKNPYYVGHRPSCWQEGRYGEKFIGLTSKGERFA